MRVQQIFGRNTLHQAVFDGAHVFARRDAGAVGDAEDVGIHRHHGLAVGGIEDDVGGFAPDAGQFFQCGAVSGDFAVVVVDKDLAGFEDVRRFAVVEANGFDVFLQAVFAEGKDGSGGVGSRKEAARGFVHAFVGRLCREDDGDEQFEGAAVFEFGGRLRVFCFEAAEAFGDSGGGHGVVVGCMVPGGSTARFLPLRPDDGSRDGSAGLRAVSPAGAAGEVGAVGEDVVHIGFREGGYVVQPHLREALDDCFANAFFGEQAFFLF